MPAKLNCIVLENFKSYKEKTIVGPLNPFNAVTGPNGSGKSNFMDAISFVMGETTRNLRVKKLSDLICGAHIGKAISKSTSVIAVFSLENEESGEEMSFERSAHKHSSEYKINGSVVSYSEYLSELEKLGINVKAKNFLVFQGAVESVAMKNPKEMAAIFEEISGSRDLKDEYDKLEQEMKKTEEELSFIFKKKKCLNAQHKEAKLMKEEADKYARVKEDLTNKQVEHQLFRLFHNESATKKFEMEHEGKQIEVDKIQKRKEEVEQALKDKKKNHGKLSREMAKIEQDIREADVQIYKKRPQFIKVKERVSHTRKKLDQAITTLDQARKAHDAHMNDIKKLEDELAEVEKIKGEYEEQIAEESQTEGRDLHLEDAQVSKYHKLREEAAKRSSKYMQIMDSVTRDQKSDQDKLDNLSRMKTDNEYRHKQKCHEKEEIEKRIERLEEHIRVSEQALVDQKQMRADLESDVGMAKGKVQDIQKQLDDVLEQLGDAHTNKHENSRRQKKQEILEKLKADYSGVYGRMIDVCHPKHERYNIPITKVFGKYLEAIVVDTEHTAINCIQYLKEHMWERETFLAIDSIRCAPIKEHLRSITDPRGVKLLYDVLQFEPHVANAVLFVTNNALICETAEDANMVAYELGGRNNAVALDGTYYQKSGIMSGGTLDLARRAKRWDEKQLSELKQQKENLTAELREAMTKSRKEFELNTVCVQIEGLETRLLHAKTDVENMKKQLKEVQIQLDRLSNQMTSFGPQIEEIENSMRSREQQIEEVNMKMNSVEDVVFSNFCTEIGVHNIRQYEKRDLRAQEERKRKRLEFEKQMNKITSNLEFERSRETEINVSRWVGVANEETERLEIIEKQLQKFLEEIDKDNKLIAQLKDQKLSKKKEIDAMEDEVGKTRKEVGVVTKTMQTAQKALVSIEGKIESKRSDRHAILMQCKIVDIDIPMLVGNMEDIVASDPQSLTSSCDSSAAHLDKEARMKIDYNMLSDEMKDLEDLDEIKAVADKLLSAINTLTDTLNKIVVTNLSTVHNLKDVQSKYQSTNEEFIDLQKRNRNAKKSFDRIKQERYNKFTRCFDHVSNEIDGVYKSIAQEQSAQALLILDNPEEPYLGGVNYNCVAPHKRCQPMSNLSGGEKTIAALALLFAIHSYQPAPFFILDEVDAALDNININKVTKYFNEKKKFLQLIAISLKNEFFGEADKLIGIYTEPDDCLGSKIAMMDLSQYDVN